MTAMYTFDVFCSLDGFGSYDGGDWGGYWGKAGPEFLERRLALYGEEQRMVLGGQDLSAVRGGAWPECRGGQGGRSGEHPDDESADDGGVDDLTRTAGLAECDAREW